jgi:predicted transcriptional regulator
MKSKRTANIHARTTLEMKAFIIYLANKYETDRTDIIETAVREYYNRQLQEFRSTVDYGEEVQR